MGEKDNFWSMGETGPCGPCSEIIIDQGAAFGCGRPECAVGCDCDRYLELWNLVFMQFNRDQHGVKTPLPRPSIDTGMGLERITAVVQGAGSNYDTDLFLPLIRCVEQLSRKPYGKNPENDVSIRIIADHSRATAFLIGDGVLPSNEGRGYVLRRIMRRAARHGKKLGLAKPFLCDAVKVVAEEMEKVYPEITRSLDYIVRVVLTEEENFSATLEAGLKILQEKVDELHTAQSTVIPGDIAFKLYDTYGFPLDLTEDIAAEYGMHLDEEGFEQAMLEQRTRARESWKGSGADEIAAIYKKLSQEGVQTAFKGYDTVEIASRVRAIIRNGEVVSRASQGDQVELVTTETCFYGEAGGQSGDCGSISSQSASMEVSNTLRPLPELIAHQGRIISGTISSGDEVKLRVDRNKRQATASNHTATHILHAVLREVLGKHVKQAGSLVSPERLRFDFTHFAALSREELEKVEALVNERIRQNAALSVNVVPLSDALSMGATALFGEKYGTQVRVVQIPEYSMELCGGTHNERTGEIGVFKIVSEGGIAAGVRRIEAVTGHEAYAYIKQQDTLLRNLSQLLKTERDSVLTKVERLLAEQKQLEKEISTLKGQLIAKDSGSIMDTVRTIGGVRVLVTKVPEADAKALREYGDRLKDRMESGIIVVGSAAAGTAQIIAMVTKDIAKRFPARRIIEMIAPVIEGRGGGKDEMAQAGGKCPEKLDEALTKAAAVIEALGQER
jgi:alanyl-tRNA synthetase